MILLFDYKKNSHGFVCLFDWALEPSPVMGRPLLRGTASSPRGWRVCNTPSSPEGTLSTPRRVYLVRVPFLTGIGVYVH